MSNKKQICIISPSLKMGGIERALSVLSSYFITTNFEVTFISCLPGDHFYKLQADIKLIEPSIKHSGGLKNGLIYYPKLLLFIRKTVKQIDPDVVLAFGDLFSPLVLLALFKIKYPVFVSDRTSPDYKFKFPIPLMKKLLYTTSAGFIAQTRRAADWKRKQFGKKLNIQVIPNALREVKLFPEIQREKIILYVGRFAWEKGPDKLIKAFSMITDKEGWTLHMAGSGPMLEDMKNLTEELNLQSSINFLGKVDNVDELYARSGIYALPSVLEGFPNSLCEAMAAGLPCVCFDSIPYEDIFEQDKSGIAVPLNDITALCNEITKLIKNKDTREFLGNNALVIGQRLHVDVIGNEVLEFITARSNI